jgi:hypothetical protein
MRKRAQKVFVRFSASLWRTEWYQIRRPTSAIRKKPEFLRTDAQTHRRNMNSQARKTLDFGLWTLDFGPWTLDLGLWTLDFGPWTAFPLATRLVGLGWTWLDQGRLRAIRGDSLRSDSGRPVAPKSNEGVSPAAATQPTVPEHLFRVRDQPAEIFFGLNWFKSNLLFPYFHIPGVRLEPLGSGESVAKATTPIAEKLLAGPGARLRSTGPARAE